MDNSWTPRSVADTEKYVSKVASHRGWMLNRDEELVGFLVEGLTMNWNRYGYYNCPCRLSRGDKSFDRDIICPCVYAQPDIEEYGHCYCGLYLSREYYAANKPVASIPERRKK